MHEYLFHRTQHCPPSDTPPALLADGAPVLLRGGAERSVELSWARPGTRKLLEAIADANGKVDGSSLPILYFYESPYTDVAPEGPNGLFEPDDVTRLIDVVHGLRQRAEAS